MADNKFHCIILKGGDQYPYFPRPLLSEFDFSVPLGQAPSSKRQKKKKKSLNPDGDDPMADGENKSDEEGDEQDSDNDDDDQDSETRKLEQQFLLHDIRAAQLRDLVDASSSGLSHRTLLSRVELDVDKTLLQLLAVECRSGEDRSMRALEMAELMRDRSGRMFEAAGKVAERYGRTMLGDKIRELGEKRVSGRDDEDDF